MKDPKTNAGELVRNAQIVLDEARRLEPGATEVFASRSTDLKVVYEAKDFSVAAQNSTDMYGVRAIVDGRLGFTTTNTAEETGLQAAAKEAQQVARLSVPNEHHRLAAKPASPGHFELFDPKLAALPPKDAFAFAAMVVEEALKEGRVAIDRVELTVSSGAMAIASSIGFSQTAAWTSCNFFVMGMGKTETEVSNFDYDGGMVWRLSDLDQEIRRAVGKFRDSAIGSLGARRGRSYKGKVLLHPEEVSHLLAGIPAANCDGLRQQDGMSPWKGKKGELVASPMINLYEDPRDESRPEGWAPFDREGVPTVRHDLIREGALAFVAQSCFSASRVGEAPTGNAVGSARSLPAIGFRNLSIEPSARAGRSWSDEELQKELGSGLLLKRFSGNVDPTSGNFSGVAKNSYWIEDGARAHAVNEMMVSGNVFDLLKQVVALGSRSHGCFGGNRAPYVLVDGLSVTSG